MLPIFRIVIVIINMVNMYIIYIMSFSVADGCVSSVLLRFFFMPLSSSLNPKTSGSICIVTQKSDSVGQTCIFDGGDLKATVEKAPCCL